MPASATSTCCSRRLPRAGVFHFPPRLKHRLSFHGVDCGASPLGSRGRVRVEQGAPPGAGGRAPHAPLQAGLKHAAGTTKHGPPRARPRARPTAVTGRVCHQRGWKKGISKVLGQLAGAGAGPHSHPRPPSTRCPFWRTPLAAGDRKAADGRLSARRGPFSRRTRRLAVRGAWGARVTESPAPSPPLAAPRCRPDSQVTSGTTCGFSRSRHPAFLAAVLTSKAER